MDASTPAKITINDDDNADTDKIEQQL